MIRHPLIQQIARFGIIGIAAAALHYCIVVLLVQNQIAEPLVANVFGFVWGFQVSYWGHRNWTFASLASHRRAAPKMVVVQTLNFIGNETLFYILLSFGLPYTLALLIVLMVLPIFTFIASKVWVFN